MIVEFQNTKTGEIYGSWNLTKSQEDFMSCKQKFVLFSGGYGCGKSLVLTLKAIELANKYPGNFILMGRRTYPELRDTLIKEFFNYCPDYLIKDYLKAEGRVIFYNGSEIIFRHLDTMAESEIRSMNLGAAFIDQVEDISEAVVMGLRGRLRRASVPDGEKRIFMTCNPALTWLFREFKQDPKPEYKVIEASTLENQDNLPRDYVEDLLKYPESYKQQFVYGVWDESLLSTDVVFAPEYQRRLRGMTMDPIETKEGFEIYKRFRSGNRYRVGVDPVEGGDEAIDPKERMKQDMASITIVDATLEEEVATWSGRVPPDVLAEKVLMVCGWYSDKISVVEVVPEMNAMGLAFVNKFRELVEGKNNIRLYRREEFDKTTNKKMLKYGWRTTRQTKPLLVNRFQDMLRLRNPKVYSSKKVEQMKSFVYTDEVRMNGMGAKGGFHDDELMSLFLAFWEKHPVKSGTVHQGGVVDTGNKDSMIEVINGKARLKGLKPLLEVEHNWKMG